MRESPRVSTERVLAEFLDGLISHYVLDDGKLGGGPCGHKGGVPGPAPRPVSGTSACTARTTGEKDEFGLPVRANWAAEYRGKAMVVYGHTAVVEPVRLNRTINIDTGCVFGGRLTALRYPEEELVSVPSARTHYEPVRPLAQSGRVTGSRCVSQRLARRIPSFTLRDVIGKRVVSTRLRGNTSRCGRRTRRRLR